MAVATVAGAWCAWAVPVWPAGLIAGLALAVRRPLLLIVATAALASGLAAWAVAGARPAAEGHFDGRAVLVRDPESVMGAVRAEVRAAGHHYEVWARGQAGGTLRQRAAGEVIDLSGSVSPRPADDDYGAHRHVVGRVTAERIELRGPGSPLARLANALRATLQRGADGLPPDRRVLFSGFVLGDNRNASVVVDDDFRAAGLGHLLVVSGENVAFVLAALSPLLRRLGPRARWVMSIGVLVVFAAMTRFEPSVLRASVMAAIAVTAWSLGRPTSGIRVLALCVTALVLIDPMLVGVFGFQLSVAACVGILVLARPLGRHLPGPAWLTGVVGVTLAAQVGVAPLLVTRPGGLVLAAVPANVLAEPAAAAVMAWGMTGGLVAGLASRLGAGGRGGGVGHAVAGVLHVPTNLGLWWVETVARWAAGRGLGEVSPRVLAAAVVLAVAAVAARRAGRRVVAGAAWAAVIAVLVVPAVTGGQPARQVAIGGVGTLWRSPGGEAGVGSVLVLVPGARAADVLAGLRGERAGRVDLVVVPRDTRTAATLVATVRERVRVDTVWTPGEGGPVVGDEAEVGGLHVRVTEARPTLEVEVTVRQPPS